VQCPSSPLLTTRALVSSCFLLLPQSPPNHPCVPLIRCLPFVHGSSHASLVGEGGRRQLLVYRSHVSSRPRRPTQWKFHYARAWWLFPQQISYVHRLSFWERLLFLDIHLTFRLPLPRKSLVLRFWFFFFKISLYTIINGFMKPLSTTTAHAPHSVKSSFPRIPSNKSLNKSLELI
jgi:hypothetical protein